MNAYEKGLPIEEIFMLQSMGITSARDDLVIDINKDALLKRIEYFSDENNSDVEVRALFFPGKKNGKYLAGDTRGWQLTEARKKVRTNNHSEKIKKISYRVFDDRYIYYVPEMIDWGREKIMNNLENEDNFALNVVKLGRNSSAHNYFVTNKITDKNITSSLDNSNCFPLYIIENSRLLANINTQILVPVLKKLGLQWIEFGMGDQDTTCGPEDIFDYIYAILHSPSYRENYKEFLKINFPRVPFMSDKNSFWRLVKIGRDIRLLHLMKSSVLRSLVTRYPIAGTNEVSKIKFDSSKERVFINAEQYFEGIDSDVWNFSIGAYQPLQKWLKDRKGRKLVSDDLLHYQQIVIAARETTRLMVQVDAVINENGGWPIND